MLRITDLTFRYGGRVVLDRAGAHVPAGHRVGLVGRNGAGKTTLLRLINRLEEPSAGRILVAGEGDLTAEQRDHLLAIADRCPVSQTLKRSSDIASSLG